MQLNWSELPKVLIFGTGSFLKLYLLTDLFSHAGHTQHSCKIQSVDFQMGRVMLTNYFNSHPKSLVYIVDILRLNW